MFLFRCSSVIHLMQETVQSYPGIDLSGIIDGCPVYGEQTSHHPPVSSILFYGRGYRVHASL